MTVEVNPEKEPSPSALKWLGVDLLDIGTNDLRFLLSHATGLRYSTRRAIESELERRSPRRREPTPRKPVFMRRGFFNVG